MKHAREDYNRIQDPENKIPHDEPVFLIRGQDMVSGDAVRAWAYLNEKAGGDATLTESARQQAALMDEWPNKKQADL